MRRAPWITATRSGWMAAVRGRNPSGVSGAKFAGPRPRPVWKMLLSDMSVPSGTLSGNCRRGRHTFGFRNLARRPASGKGPPEAANVYSRLQELDIKEDRAMRRPILPVILALLVTGGVPGTVAQEQYPTRPITLVNPFPPGGLADLTGRPLAAALERVLKQPVVVSNKAGAAGAVGMQSVAIAKPDGYTLLISVPSITLLPEVDAIFGRPPTFSRDQFAGIARLNADPVIVVVNAEEPWKNLKDLIDDAKRRPGEITFSSSGPYGASHVPTEMLLQAAGVTHAQANAPPAIQRQ